VDNVTEKIELTQRTRERNGGLWIGLDWAGLLAPVAEREAARNLLHQETIEQSLAASNELWAVKEAERDTTADLELKGIAQDKEIADLKAELGYEKLAIYQVTQDYLLAVRRFDAHVRDIIMAAREFAADVDLQKLALEGPRMQLEIDREGLRQQETRIKIKQEAINRAMVEAEVAKSQVEVAKAQVRMIMAQVAAGEAEVELVDAQAKIAMAQAEKAELQARVAMIFADISTRQLAQIRLGVETQEIADAFTWVEMKLGDMLSLWNDRKAVEFIMEDSAEILAQNTGVLLTAQEAAEDLRVKEAQVARETLTYETSITQNEIGAEAALINDLASRRIKLQDARSAAKKQTEDKETEAKYMVGGARRAACKALVNLSTSKNYVTLNISGD
jgi:hypothetical protein